MLLGRRFRIGLFILPLLLAACASGGPKPARLGAWVTYWDYNRGIDSVRSAPSLLNDIYFFAAHLDSEGAPVFANKNIPFNLEAGRVKEGNALPWLTVVNDVKPSAGGAVILKDPQVIHDLLSDPDRRRRHRSEIVRLAATHGFAGVDIDYENLRAVDRDLFSLFIRELAADLKQKGILLSVTVQPKARESRADGPGAADWADLCRSADRLQIMLYNLHSGKSGPGPIATPAWIKEILQFAESQCPRERVVPILKVSGMKWGGEHAEGVQYDRAASLAEAHRAEILRDPNGNVPYFIYTDAGGRHTVYYEDAESLMEKIAALESFGYRDVVFWSLGRQDPEFLPRLAERSGRKTGR